MAKGDTHLWLAFLGTVTIPVRATTATEAAARAYVRARHAFDETPAGPERAEARRRLDDRWDTLNDACGYTPAGSEPETERLFP